MAHATHALRCRLSPLRLLQKRFVSSASPAATANPANSDAPTIHPYRKLFPWKSLSEFVDCLQQSIVYNDGDLLAINKPWGVGIHAATVNINTKNRYLLLSELIGNSRLCVDDGLAMLAERLRLRRLEVVRSTDRNISGVILLTSNPDTAKVRKSITKALNRVKPRSGTHSIYWCITKGYPLIEGTTLKENVAIKLVEIDEFGDYKEPEIIYNPSKRSLNHKKKNKLASADAEMRIIKVNKDLATSLVEISTDTNRWKFVRCYMASKTCFILGDVRFAARIRTILGTPVKLSAQNMFANEEYEPLNAKVIQRLMVEKNKSIPLMLHQKGIVLPGFTNREDLTIETNVLPPHFQWTLERLDLLP